MRWASSISICLYLALGAVGESAHGQTLRRGSSSEPNQRKSVLTRLPTANSAELFAPQIVRQTAAGGVRQVQGVAEQVPSPANEMGMDPTALPNAGLPATTPTPGMRGRSWGGGQGAFSLPPPNFVVPPLRGFDDSTEDGSGGQGNENVRLEWGETSSADLVTLDADNASLTDILRMIAKKHQLNLVVGPNVSGVVTLSLENAQLEEVLDAVLSITGHAWNRRGNLLFVTRLSVDQPVQSTLQGRMLRVFPLNFISAADSQAVVAGLLSPVGQVFISESDSLDQAKTRELLVVEDIPASVQRVEMYLAEVDRPPLQVQIEAHVLQVVLDDLNRHGVNLKPVARIGSASLTLESLGFANTDAKSGMKIALDGTDITGLVELIQSQTNTRTLASPKLLVANRQESNIQIGKRLSYLTTTTTQTASVQSVQFLDTGVVLTVTPIISEDGQILMLIKPKVSGGQLNAETSLPEEESTELSTTVLLPDGGGVVIGGLIKEEDFDQVSEVPYFCKIPILGRLFRRSEVTKKRTEIIIALVAHIIPSVDQMRQHELNEVRRALPPYAQQELRFLGPESVMPANPHLIQSPMIEPVDPSSPVVGYPVGQPGTYQVPMNPY